MCVVTQPDTGPDRCAPRATILLRGADAPTWVVVAGASIDTWGVDATGADRVLARRYRLVAVRDQWQIYRIVPWQKAATSHAPS